jgi:glycerol uptake facilitator-like aquaporin
VTTPSAKNYAYPASLGGSIGFGMMMTNNLAPVLGSFLATLAGACIAAGMAVVIYHTVDQFTKRGVFDKRVARSVRPKADG